MNKILTIAFFFICTQSKGQQNISLAAAVKQYTVTPEMFGAKGDCIADDLPALQAAVNYLGNEGGAILIDKIYRVTNTLILGERFISESDGLQRNFTTLPSFNLTKYLAVVKKKPIKIISSGKGGIYGDFKSDTLKAVIYYTMYGDSRAWPGDEKYAAEINNLGVYGEGSFVNGVAHIIGNNVGYNYSNNQIGVIALNTFKMQVSNCTFYGFKKGLVLNNSYFSNLTNNYYKLCDIGLFHVQSHGSTINNNIAYYCNKGYEIRSGQISMSNINSEQCKIGLHILNGMNVVNGCYLEAMRTSGLSQLIIGVDSTDDGYIQGNNADGVIINALTIAVSNPDGSIGNNVMLKLTSGVVIIKGAVLSSGIFKRNGSGYIICEGVSGTLPDWAYDRTSNVTASNITSYNNVTASKTIKGDSISSNKIVNTGASTTGSLSVNGDIKKSTAYAGIVGSMKSKNVIGFYSTDYILRLGKYSIADGTKISGRLNIIGNSIYTACGWIDIMYSNLATGFAVAAITAMTSTQNIVISLVKYNDGADIWAGIRFKTNATLAWVPFYFNFDGYLSEGNHTLTSIDSGTVTGITPLTSTNTNFEIKASNLTLSK